MEAAARRLRELARSTRPNRALAKSVYDDVRWGRCRLIALERDGHQCVMCPSTHGLNVHHLLGITGTDDDFDPELVVTLCATCHPIAERRRRQGYGHRSR